MYNVNNNIAINSNNSEERLTAETSSTTEEELKLSKFIVLDKLYLGLNFLEIRVFNFGSISFDFFMI